MDDDNKQVKQEINDDNGKGMIKWWKSNRTESFKLKEIDCMWMVWERVELTC